MVEGRIFIAIKGGVVTLDGERYIIKQGVTRVREGHKLLEGREGMFKPIDVHYEVEQATAEPGEKRGETPAPVPPPTPEPPPPAPQPDPPTPVGGSGEVEGDGSGEALPPVDEQAKPGRTTRS